MEQDYNYLAFQSFQAKEMKLKKVMKLVNYLRRIRKRERRKKKTNKRLFREDPSYLVKVASPSYGDEPRKNFGGGLVEDLVKAEKSKEVELRWSSLRRKLMVGEKPCARKVNVFPPRWPIL